MYAIFKKNYHFIRDEIAHSETLGFKVRNILEEWKPNLTEKHYQEAPDWIKETGLYKLAVKDKMIIEVVPVKDDETAPKTPPEITPKPSGWGAASTGLGQNS